MAVGEVGAKFNTAITESMKAFGLSVVDPLLQYKPWRKEEIHRAYRNIKYIRDFGEQYVIVSDSISMVIEIQAPNQERINRLWR